MTLQLALLFAAKVIGGILIFVIAWGLGKVLSLKFGGYIKGFMEKKFAKGETAGGDFLWLGYWMPFLIVIGLALLVIFKLW